MQPSGATAWIRCARRAFARGASGIGRRKLPFALTAGLVAAALALVSLVRLGAHWADEAADSWEAGADMVVYLEPGASEAAAEAFARALSLRPDVERADGISPAEAMERLERAFGERGEALTGVEPALLPASVEVSLAAGARGEQRARALAADLAERDMVEEVETLGGWVERVSSAASALRRLGSLLLALAASSSLLVVAAALELALRARRRERQLLELFGAAPLWARAPVVVEGAALGAAGAAGALAIALIAYAAAKDAAGAAMGQIFGVSSAGFLPASDVVAVVFVGVLAGAAGGLVASRRGRDE